MRCAVVLLAALSIGQMACTGSPTYRLEPEWNWQVEPLPGGVTAVRLGDGGAVLAIAYDPSNPDGDTSAIARLSSAGELMWVLPVPVLAAYIPVVTATGDGAFIAGYPTGESTCRVIRIDGAGVELGGFDYSFRCLHVAGTADGSFVIGTGGSRRGGDPPEAEMADLVSLGPDGSVRWTFTVSQCGTAVQLAMTDGVVFAGGNMYECNSVGYRDPETGRPWLGAVDLDSGELLWESEGEQGIPELLLTSSVTVAGSIVVAAESDLMGTTRLRGVDRSDGSARWSVHDTHSPSVGPLDGASFIAAGGDDDGGLLAVYDVAGAEIGTWTFERYPLYTPALASAPDGSVLIPTLFEGTRATIDRYQIPR